MGSQNYGLVAFCLTVLAIGGVLVDMGIGRAVSLELAKRGHDDSTHNEMRDVLLTLQWTHFGISLLAGAAIALSAPWIAANWLKIEASSDNTEVAALLLLAAVVTVQLPRGILQAGLVGLQRQVYFNVVTSIISILRGLLTIAALFFFAATPVVFLLVQLVVSAVETGILFWRLWSVMPSGSRRAKINFAVLRDTWAYALGDGFGMLVVTLIKFGDRLLLSAILPLSVFGVYSLAVLITENIPRVVLPFSSAYFPHFAEQIARKDNEGLRRDYFRISIVIASLVMPASLLLFDYADDILILLVGTGVALPAGITAVLAIRAIANAVSSVQWFPNAIQLAAGVSSFTPIAYSVAAAIYLPGIVLLTPIYGLIAPALLWLFVNVATFVPQVWLTHRLAMQGLAWTWVIQCVIIPFVVSGVVVLLASFFAPIDITWWTTLPYMAVVGFLAMMATLLASPHTQPTVRSALSRMRDQVTSRLHR